MSTMHEVLNRIRAEFLEMPGMRLTLQQVQRLCGVEAAMGKAVLDSLVAARFLRLKPDGTYARMIDGAVDRPRAAMADLRSDARIAAAS